MEGVCACMIRKMLRARFCCIFSLIYWGELKDGLKKNVAIVGGRA